MVIVSKQDLSGLEIQLKLSLVRMELAKLRGMIWTSELSDRASLIGYLATAEIAIVSANALLRPEGVKS